MQNINTGCGLQRWGGLLTIKLTAMLPIKGVHPNAAARFDAIKTAAVSNAMGFVHSFEETVIAGRPAIRFAERTPGHGETLVAYFAADGFVVELRVSDLQPAHGAIVDRLLSSITVNT